VALTSQRLIFIVLADLVVKVRFRLLVPAVASGERRVPRGRGLGSGAGCVDQQSVGGGKVKAVRKQSASWRAQGQVAGMRMVRLRWPRTMRAAVCSSR
jgi:hypothetical protein